MVPERSCLVWLPEPGGGYGAPPELAWRYSRLSSANVSCSVLISRSTSSGGISTQVVVTGSPADVLAVCLRPMSVLPPTIRVRTLVNWSRGAGVMVPWWHEKARLGRAYLLTRFRLTRLCYHENGYCKPHCALENHKSYSGCHANQYPKKCNWICGNTQCRCCQHNN